MEEEKIVSELDSQLPDADEERIKSELSNLPSTILICGVVAICLFLILPTDKSRFGGYSFFSIPIVIGRSIGSLILPTIICLFFKRKSRAFVVSWVIFLALSITGMLYEYSQRY